ncbi:MAG TPA: M20 family metallopeptidase [Pyrinomonadaceae bacterium]|nr:M20 family metallopeptidase [Pyrinomonadaceae bacterium]
MEAAIEASVLTSTRMLIEQRQEQVVQLIRDLVELESPSADVPGSLAVNQLLETAGAEISSVDSVERVASPGYGEHFLLRAFGETGDGRQATLLLGHTDTVHQRGSLPIYVEGDRMYGPGVFDMKGSCVMAIEALRCLSDLAINPRRPVTLLLTCDEEIGSITGRSLVEREARRAKQVLVLEPPAPGGCAKTARKGVGAWTVKARGIAAHAGLDPEQGASAILELARQTERLHALNDSGRGTNFNVGLIRGGTRGNVVAADAEMEVDVRFGDAAEASRVEILMSSLKPFDRRVTLAVNGGINRGPLERTAGVVELFRQARQIAARLDFELGECSVGGASDGNFAAALNVPVLDGLGLDGDGAHAAHEHIRLSAIVRRTALLAGLIATL